MQKLNKVTVPRVMSDVEETQAIPRRPYPWMARPERRALAMSMAHYQRRLHCRGRISERGLVLAYLKGW